MKITKQQLKLIIRESILAERGTGNPELQSEERAIMNAVVAFVDKYRLTNSLDPSDISDDRRVRLAIQDIISSIIGEGV